MQKTYYISLHSINTINKGRKKQPSWCTSIADRSPSVRDIDETTTLGTFVGGGSIICALESHRMGQQNIDDAPQSIGEAFD